MDPFFRNKINKYGHKNTNSGFKVIEKAVKDKDIQTTVKMFLKDCSDDGANYSSPIWQQHALMYMIKGKFYKEIENEEQEPLWFNVARDIIGHFMTIQELRKKAYERILASNSNESTARIHDS